jgi:hypothetical protein
MFNVFVALLRSSVMLSITKVANYERKERIEANNVESKTRKDHDGKKLWVVLL